MFNDPAEPKFLLFSSQGSRTLTPFVSLHIERPASWDSYRRDATVSQLYFSLFLDICEGFPLQSLQTKIHFWYGITWTPLSCPVPVHLIDIYNVIEAVRDAGLNAVELNAGISVTRLENLVSSLFNQLSKRLPTTHTINPRESTVLLVDFILAALDRYQQVMFPFLCRRKPLHSLGVPGSVAGQLTQNLSGI